MILQLAVSRQREYLADATAAQYLGEGCPLAEALRHAAARCRGGADERQSGDRGAVHRQPAQRARDVALLDPPPDGGADPLLRELDAASGIHYSGLAPLAALAAGSSGLSGSRHRSRSPASRRIMAALAPVSPLRSPLGSSGVALELPEDPEDVDARGRESA